MKKRYNYWYWVAGKWIRAGLEVYFRRRVKVGMENIPYDKPIIFAPNHQNAFMDAFSCVIPVHNKKQTGFMVRADVFKGKTAIAFLRSLKMFPAYRMRDGIENLSKNEEAFAEAYDLLEHNEGLIVFPEANHALPRSLRPLKKGICRSAFGAEIKNNWELDVHIVPVGINYSDQEFFGGENLTIFGKPIRLADYKALYLESPGKANKQLIDRIQEEMSPLMIDIQDMEAIEAIELLREIDLNNELDRKAPLIEKFKRYKESISKWELFFQNNPEEKPKIIEQTKEYEKELKKWNLLDYLIGSSPKKMGYFLFRYFLLAVFSPIFLVGWIGNILPFWYPTVLAKKIKDVGFRSSIKMAGAMVTFALWYIVLMLIGFFVFPVWWWAFGVPFVLGVSGLLALKWWRLWNKTGHLLRYKQLKKSGKLTRLESLRQSLRCVTG